LSGNICKKVVFEIKIIFNKIGGIRMKLNNYLEFSLGVNFENKYNAMAVA